MKDLIILNEVAPVIDCNFEEVKNDLSIRLEDYKKLVVTEEAFNHIAEVGYDPQFGARPVKRVIQKQVLNELSKAILSGTIDTTDSIVMDVFDHKIVFRKPIYETETV